MGATPHRVRRFIVTVLIETEGDDPSGNSVRAVEFSGLGGYQDEVLESACLEIAPWSDGSEDG